MKCSRTGKYKTKKSNKIMWEDDSIWLENYDFTLKVYEDHDSCTKECVLHQTVWKKLDLRISV
jgi:hypothetical protein